MAPRIFNLGTRRKWIVIFTSKPPYALGIITVFIRYDMGSVPEPTIILSGCQSRRCWVDARADDVIGWVPEPTMIWGGCQTDDDMGWVPEPTMLGGCQSQRWYGVGARADDVIGWVPEPPMIWGGCQSRRWYGVGARADDDMGWVPEPTWTLWSSCFPAPAGDWIPIPWQHSMYVSLSDFSRKTWLEATTCEKYA
jgi:hypothetical protein